MWEKMALKVLKFFKPIRDWWAIQSHLHDCYHKTTDYSLGLSMNRHSWRLILIIDGHFQVKELKPLSEGLNIHVKGQNSQAAELSQCLAHDLHGGLSMTTCYCFFLFIYLKNYSSVLSYIDDIDYALHGVILSNEDPKWIPQSWMCWLLNILLDMRR